MPKIKVDPVTRIEGHLRVEAQVEDGHVTEAWASGTMFRGLEIILRGRDAREAWIWAQRICGVCTTVHALASVRAVENALDVEVPPNAELVRTLIGMTQLVHDHVIHFYHLHALDWVDVANALKADPGKTSRLAQSISDWPTSGRAHFAEVQGRVKKLVDSGQLSLFASGYWGHPAYRLLARGEPDGGGALPGGAPVAARRDPHPRRAGGQEPASADLRRGRHGDAAGPRQPAGHKRRADRVHARARSTRCATSSSASTCPTCWPSRPPIPSG